LATTSLDCTDTDPCTNDLCNAATGCAHPPNTGNSCNDGNVCTIGDTCTNGACGGEADGCSDGNACSDDACANGIGCQHSANALACSDGDACTTGDACAASSCKAGPQMVCDDGDVCTAGDHCLAGNCVPGAAIACDDANPCTVDFCDAVKGCQYGDNGGAVCGDSGVCGGGQCACPGGFAIQGEHCPPVLTGITLTGAVLSPGFDIGATSYVASLPLSATQAELTVTAPAGVAVTLSVHGGPITTLSVGEPSAVSLRIGANLIKLTAIHAGMSKPYEVTVTRLPTVQQAYIKAQNADTGWGDSFGTALAMSGDTLVIGVPFDDSAASGIGGDSGSGAMADSGSVQVYRRVGATWAFEAYIKAANPDAGDRFGTSVALDGDRLVVGAPYESSWPTSVQRGTPDNTWPESGAAYVFARQNGQWRQTAVLKAASGDAGDRFGQAVAVSGGSIAIGCPGEDSSATGINANQASNNALQSGAVYVFADRFGTWRPQVFLKASNAEAGDLFGSAVSLSADTLVVGAPGEASKAAGVGGSQANNAAPGSGAGYVFTRSGATWSQQSYLKASNPDAGDHFGGALAIAGDQVVAGASGEDGNGLSQLDNSRTDAGAAYVFARAGGVWVQQGYLKASAADAMDEFGAAVALRGSLTLVGAPGESSGNAGINADPLDNGQPSSGAAYLFARKGSAWAIAAYLKASNPDANDQFGATLAFDGNTAVVAAPSEGSQAVLVGGDQADNTQAGAGAAYAFSGDACLFDQAAECDDGNACTTDSCEDTQFCSHAAVAEGGACGLGGAVCQSAACTCADGLLHENDACRPVLSSLSVSAGALQPAFTAGTPTFHVTGWNSTTVTADAAAEVSLALSLSDGPTMTLAPSVASSALPLSGGGPTVGSGSTLLSVLATRAGVTAAHDVLVWSPKAWQNGYVKASTSDGGDGFGSAVAVSGNLMVVGAPGERSCATGIGGSQASNSCPDAGAAYVFSYEGGGWVQQAYLKPATTRPNQRFGAAVAISGTYIVIGAPGEASASASTPTDMSKPGSGAAYVFAYQGSAWVQEAYIKGSPDIGDQLGASVAISSSFGLVLIGVPNEASCQGWSDPDWTDNGCPGAGAAWVYQRNADGSWGYKIYAKANTPVADDNFGAAVSIAGTTASYCSGPPCCNSYPCPAPTYMDHFSVGAPGASSGRGQVHGFYRSRQYFSGADHISWFSKGGSSTSALDPGDHYGAAIVYRTIGNANVVLVGAPGDDSAGDDPSDNSMPDAGAVYWFAGTTSLYLKAPHPGAGDQFGAAVEFSGTRVVIGAPGEDSGARGTDGNPAHDGSLDSGAAYVFDNCLVACQAPIYIKSSNSDPGDRFGSSVAISGTKFAIGAYGEASGAAGLDGDQTSNAKPSSGAVYVY